MSGRVYARKFDWDEAARLCREGLTHKQIAERFGVSADAIVYAISPTRRAQAKATTRRHQRSGTCVDCGCQISRNYSRPALRCIPCMALAMATSVRETELWCSTCREWKPDAEFPASRAEPARRTRHGCCRSCCTALRREYRRRNREKENAYQRERRRASKRRLEDGAA